MRNTKQCYSKNIFVQVFLVIAFNVRRTQHIVLGFLFLCYSVGIPVLLSWDSCVTQLGFLWYSVGIPVVLSWDSCGTQMGFLWYSLGIPVILKDDFLWYRFSSYVCIFCTFLNNLSCFVTTYQCGNSNHARTDQF